MPSRPTGGASSESPTWRSIAVTMLVTFVVVFGLMYRRPPAESRGNTPPPAPAAGRAHAPVPAAAQPAAQPQPIAENSAGAPRVRDSATSADPPLPVRVSFMHYNRPGKDDPGTTVPVMNGRIWNQSAGPLTVDVVLTSAGGGSTAQAQVTVNPRGVGVFGQNDGLELHPGDTVMLRSLHFADLGLPVN